MKQAILVVDDDSAVSTVLTALLNQAGYTAHRASNGEEALDTLEVRPFDAVLSDVRMPVLDGMGLLDEIKERWPDLPVVMLTAHGTVDLAVEAMKAGAADFLNKPFERDEVLAVMKKVLTAGSRSADRPPAAPRSHGIVGESPAMAGVFDVIDRAAPGMATVLIRGETGTGKGLVAQALHERSARSNGPLIKVQCGGLPENLLESELFGYEKGAFTGAQARKPGRVELAQGGTLFLDEIGDVSPTMQVKLLRVLQEREFERLGGTETLEADVRFVAATHRDLETMVDEGGFREDLFYRLNVIPVDVPPLRDRLDDVPVLARHFCELFAERNARPGATLTASAVDALARCDWPGNVRQLQNVIERLVVLSPDDQIDRSAVESELARMPRRSRASVAEPDPDGDPSTLEAQRRMSERTAVEDALRRCRNNRTQAARLLGISRRTLYYKLEELGL